MKTLPGQFDRRRLRLLPLSRRRHDLALDSIKKLEPVDKSLIPRPIEMTAEQMLRAVDHQAPIILMMGAHVIRSGVQRYLIDLMKKGYLSCLAFNGAGPIHDFELALIGATTESVARYIRDGRFGLWEETGRLNDIVNQAWRDNPRTGFGLALGRAIERGSFPHKSISLFAAAARLGIPATVHVHIGCDIVHEHPNFDPAAAGTLSYNDFLTFTAIIEKLENGVIMNFGSAVMAPEIYLKALAMARNAASRENRQIRHIHSLVCDIKDLGDDFASEPSKERPEYYFRPLKTMLIRTVADGGQGYYVCGPHARTIPALWTAVQMAEKNKKGKP